MEAHSFGYPRLAAFFSTEVLNRARTLLFHPKGVPKQTTTNQDSRVFEIPSYLASTHFTNALGDYCAKRNFMKEEYAIRLGLSIDRKDTSDVAIGSGKVTTTGTARTLFRFKDENQAYPLTFHLLPKCIHDVILGKPFLKATSTFSNLLSKTRRVKERILKGIAHHHLLYLGDSAPRFKGLLNGAPIEALADSGAKVMVMDEDYARSIGLSVSTEQGCRTKLIFADDSTAYTSGMTYGVEWAFGLDGSNKRYTVDFHILKNAPASVILSDTFLFDAEAYSRYECYLVDEDDEDDDAYFFAIDVDVRYSGQGKSPQSHSLTCCYSSHTEGPPFFVSVVDGNHLELVRRGEEEDRIANLPAAEQDAAWAIEYERRARWDQLQTSQPSAIQAQQPVSSCNASSASHTLSDSTFASISEQPSHAFSSPAPGKRSRWRFKLKQKSTTARTLAAPERPSMMRCLAKGINGGRPAVAPS